jgi:hypothetical protein
MPGSITHLGSPTVPKAVGFGWHFSVKPKRLWVDEGTPSAWSCNVKCLK